MGQKLFCKLMEINFQYIFITALINLVSFTDDCFLNDNSLLSVNFQCACSGCVSVFVLTEYDTPKKKDKICRQTTTAFQRNSVLQGFDGYAPCSAVWAACAVSGFPRRHAPATSHNAAVPSRTKYALQVPAIRECLCGKPWNPPHDVSSRKGA